MMMKRKLIIAVLTTFCVTFALFAVMPTRSANSPTYDPWLDVNDDGRVDMRDIGAVCNGFGQHGTAIDKAIIEYDSEWIDITDNRGQYFTITHNLNSTDVMVDIQGKTTLDGGVHQRYFGGTDFVAGWNQTYGGTSDDAAYSVVQTSDGGYAFSGVTKSSGAGIWDFWLVKTDASGNMQWNKTYGGTGTEYGCSLVETGDGGYALAGLTESSGAGLADFWLVKTDASGNMQWNKTYGGTGYDQCNSVVQTSDGGYAMAGSTTSYGAGSDDFWLVKTDSTGNALWSKTYGGTGVDYAVTVVQTGDGGYALAGTTRSFGAGDWDFWLVKTDVNGNMQWNKTYGGTGDDRYSCSNGFIQTVDEKYVITGQTGSFGGGGFDVWLIKTDASGNAEWTKTFGGTNNDCGTSLIQTSDGGYLVGGNTYSFGVGNYDGWLVKTDALGQILWNQTYGGTNADTAFGLAQTSDGGYALTGYTYSFGAGSVDAWLIKTDSAGNALDGFRYGLAWVDSTANTIKLYRGTDDEYWNYVRICIWKPKAP